jgi:dTDP-4-dehydrorhamnose 3,5-epimerase
MPFKCQSLSIPAVLLIEPVSYKDDRGFFLETYKASEFEAFGIKERFVQDNSSWSRRTVLRGLHYQRPPRAQGKLVMVVQGEIFDVAVDIRKGSPTFGGWVGLHLTAADRKLLYVPVGFAHGFCVLSESAEVCYKVTSEYSPDHDAGLLWSDPDIAITWPVQDPIVSRKDAALPRLKEVDTGFNYV